MSMKQARVKQANESIGGKVDRVTKKRTWLKTLGRVSVFSVALMLAFSTVSYAVDAASEDDDKLNKFKMKVASKQPSSTKKKQGEEAADASADGGEKAVLEFTSTANPLGMAGSLPVKGGLPSGTGLPGQAVPQTPEELQAQMEVEADMQRQKLKEETFNTALRTLLPLTPAQIRQTYNAFEKSREAAETPILFSRKFDSFFF